MYFNDICPVDPSVSGKVNEALENMSPEVLNNLKLLMIYLPTVCEEMKELRSAFCLLGFIYDVSVKYRRLLKL